jgi:hypothetical protein
MPVEISDVVVAGVGHRRHVEVLKALDSPLVVFGLSLAEPSFVDLVKYFPKLRGIDLNRRVNVLGDQRRDIIVSYLRMVAFSVI